MNPIVTVFEVLERDQMRLCCPVCGFDCTHLERVWSEEGGDPGEPEGRSEAGELYGVPVGGIAHGWRRGCLAVQFSCESGHDFVIRFQQHKGSTLIFADEVKP